MDYKTLYLCLFNNITDAIDLIAAGRPERAELVLKSAQLRSEEMYISSGL